ncbi:DUF222 domain-containing protein, partial [Intrasporangium sp.]|uniref:HNH endonuclease n=1 Tax=Intrasporangium sp. TaxID=1925024 RepID=UPI0032220CF4
GEVDAATGTPAAPLDVDALHALVATLGATRGHGRSDAELIDQLDALEKVKAAAAAAQARLTARFVAAQAREADRLEQLARDCSDAGDFDGWVTARDAARARRLPPEQTSAGNTPGRQSAEAAGRGSSSRRRAAAVASRTGVSAQVGLARRESPARGARLARAAVTLVQDLPHTLSALAAGHLCERRAELVVKATSHLSPQLRAIVDTEVIQANTPAPGDPAGSGLSGWGDREVQRRVRACADRLDPEAAVERARRAREDRRVSVRPVPDCMALVAALLPVEMAVAVYAALAQAAAAAKAAGDPRSRGQVMADTLHQRVTGQATAEDLGLQVQVVITDRALFDGDDTPAHVPGYGPVPAGWVRDRLTTDLPEHSNHPATPEGDAPQPPDRPSPTDAHQPPGTHQPSDTNHPPGSSNHPPGTGQSAAQDRTHGGGAPGGAGRGGTPKHTTPGHATRGTSEAEAHRAPQRPPGGGPPDGGAPRDATSRAARHWLRRLYTHPGTGTLVAMDSTARLFPAGLRRFLIARDGVCRTPWCDAPIRHADHIHPHTDGGPTSQLNGQGLCIRCNLTKDLPGWHTQVTDPGPAAGSDQPHTTRITTPTGHSYTSTAPPLLPAHHEHPATTGTTTAVIIELHRTRWHHQLEYTPDHHRAG